MANGPESPQRRHDSWLFLVSGGVLMLALLTGLAREQRWGERVFLVRLLTPTADNLEPGMDVRLSGLTVGRVDKLDLLGDASVAITLAIGERYRHLIGPGSRASQGQEGLIGERFVTISPDPSPPGKPAMGSDLRIAYLPGLDVPGLLVQLAQTRLDLSRTLEQTTRLAQRDVPLTLGSVRRTLGSVQTLSGSLHQQVLRSGPNLDATLRQASSTGASAQQTSEEARQFLRENHPLVVRTLQELTNLTTTGTRLLQSLERLGLLEPADTPHASPRPEQAGPPSGPSHSGDGSSGNLSPNRTAPPPARTGN